MSYDPGQRVKIIEEELNRARAKHPVWPNDAIHRAMIIMDQAGGVAKEAFKVIYGGNSREYLEREVLHLTVVCVRWLEGG